MDQQGSFLSNPRALPSLSFDYFHLTGLERALFAKESMPRLSRYWHLLQRGKPSKGVFDRRKATAASSHWRLLFCSYGSMR
jgi:hypothetical protein